MKKTIEIFEQAKTADLQSSLLEFETYLEDIYIILEKYESGKLDLDMEVVNKAKSERIDLEIDISLIRMELNKRLWEDKQIIFFNLIKSDIQNITLFYFYRVIFFIYNNMEYDNNWFIEKSKLIHGDKYDYSLVDYKNFEKLKINDNIKTNYCLENKVKLIRVKYDEEISHKLKSELSEIVNFNI